MNRLKKFLGACFVSAAMLGGFDAAAQSDTTRTFNKAATKTETPVAKTPAAPKMDAQKFAAWLKTVKKEAIAKGISPATVNAALPDDMKPLERVVSFDRKQPEKVQTFVGYIKAVQSEKRIDTGYVKLEQHRAALEKASATYGVDAEAIVALWGIETNYGRNTGSFSVVQSLATMSFEGRRAEFFKSELFRALEILDQGHIALADFKGSWAGAMGQNQFMPSSFFSFAADGDGDGKRDIWKNHADIFASTANYLKKCGWKNGQIWGEAIALPAKFDRNLLGTKTQRSVEYWKSLGIKVSGKGSVNASVIQPDGAGTQAYIVYDNFRVFMRWNNSQMFAGAAGMLTEKFKKPQAPKVVTPPPKP